MVRDDDIALVQFDDLDAGCRDVHRGYLQVEPGPVSEDPVVDGGGRSEYTVNHDERGEQHRDDEEERDQYECSYSSEQSAKHGR